MPRQKSSFTRRLETLMEDYGYRFTGDTLICCGIRGFTSDQVIGRFSCALLAAEYLIPRLRDDEYWARLDRIRTDAADTAASAKYGF